jgi:hypothetical protein
MRFVLITAGGVVVVVEMVMSVVGMQVAMPVVAVGVVVLMVGVGIVVLCLVVGGAAVVWMGMVALVHRMRVVVEVVVQLRVKERETIAVAWVKLDDCIQ